MPATTTVVPRTHSATRIRLETLVSKEPICRGPCWKKHDDKREEREGFVIHLYRSHLAIIALSSSSIFGLLYCRSILLIRIASFCGSRWDERRSINFARRFCCFFDGALTGNSRNFVPDLRPIWRLRMLYVGLAKPPFANWARRENMSASTRSFKIWSGVLQKRYQRITIKVFQYAVCR